MSCELSMIIDLLKDLTSPNIEGNTESSKDESQNSIYSLDKILESNLKNFKEKVDTYKKLSSFYIAYKELENTTCQNSDPIKWKFVCACLNLLELLHTSSTKSDSTNLSIVENFDQSQTEKSPHPSTLLSIGQQKVVLTAIQFIVCLGICPNLNNGVGIPVSRRSQFAQLLSKPETCTVSNMEKKVRLMTCAKILMPCIKNPSLGALILSRHLNDLLAILLQLCYGYTEASTRVMQQDVESVVVKDSAKHENFSNDSTPSSVLDFVTGQQNGKHCLDNLEADNSIRGLSDEQQIIHVEQDHRNEGTEGGSGDHSEVDVRITHKLLQDDIEFAEKSLKTLLNQVYPPMLVRELLLLQGGAPVAMSGKVKAADKGSCVSGRTPTWLRKICGVLLSDILMRSHGIHHVILGMLGGATVTGTASVMTQSADWKKCDAVARVIATSPQRTTSVEQYFKHAAPQILELLQHSQKKMAQQYLRIACSTISNMAAQHPDLAKKHLIQPLINPLLSCTEDIDYTEEQQVIVDETSLGKCIEDIHRLYVTGPTPHVAVLSAIRPIVHILFDLFCASKQGVSNLRTATFEIIVAILKQSEESWSLSCLHDFSFGTSGQLEESSLRMNTRLAFAPGPNGGTVVTCRLTESSSETPLGLQEEIRVPAMVDLLKALQTDGLTGEFFLSLLKELTELISVETSAVRNDVATDTVPQGKELLELEMEENRAVQNFSRKLMLLHLLAALCEEMGPSCITSAKHTIEFIQATLERGVQVCEQTDDEMFGAFETETVTMAMGLLTALLGGAMKIEEEDRKKMDTLLPLLQKLSSAHPDEHVQEMASDLRIAIATHGVVWSEMLKQSSNPSSQKVKKIHKHTAKDASAEKPKIEVISDTLTSESSADNTKSDRSLQADIQNGIGNEIKCSSLCMSNKDMPSELEQRPDTSVQDKKLLSNETESKLSEENDLEGAFRELCDPLIPVRGHALLALAKLAKSKSPSIVAKQETILKIFEENIDHPDSYLYLASANGLAAMADIFPDVVIPRLAHKFADLQTDNNHSKKSELRLKLGESLMKAIRSMGEMVVKYRELLLSAMLTGSRDEDELVRASSLSNLGELCRLLRFSLAGVLHEVLNCCTSLLKFDTSVEVRKAAALTLTLLLQGLGKDSLTVLDTVLRDIYRVLKSVMSMEKEESVKLHAHLALNELENIMKENIFPKQTLQKKIRVLDPD